LDCPSLKKKGDGQILETGTYLFLNARVVRIFSGPLLPTPPIQGICPLLPPKEYKTSSDGDEYSREEEYLQKGSGFDSLGKNSYAIRSAHNYLIKTEISFFLTSNSFNQNLYILSNIEGLFIKA